MTKINLHKKSINDPSTANLRAYRRFHNIYTQNPKSKKKLYFETNFQKAKSNPKKTWDLIREAIGSESKNSKITKITVAGKTLDDPSLIPNEFNSFFATAGKNIANSISDTPVTLFIKTKDASVLEFTSTSQGEIVDII